MGHHVGMSLTIGAGAETKIIDNMRPRQPLKESMVAIGTRYPPTVSPIQARNAKLSARIISSTLEIPSIQVKFKPL